MELVDRSEELERLVRLAKRRDGALAVLYGRRRVGKTRLLLEWVARSQGLYAVADQSSAQVQRRYFAQAVGERLPGFADVAYPDWRSLFERLARDAKAAGWRGPLVIDELPYLVLASPELPSVLQRWIDHEAKAARLVVALAGSAQRMMQGLVLSPAEPLYGRATEIIALQPLEPRYLAAIARGRSGAEIVELFAAWGGVPRYWELDAEEAGTLPERIDRLVLDPLGALHREPDRLLLEEIPPATDLRSTLDAIGGGAHRASEIAARVGRPVTSLSRPLQRLVEMGLIRRETPFGEPEARSKRSLYKIDDPFSRLWFRVVAPHRAQLAAGKPADRRALLRRHWPALVAHTWEDLSRRLVVNPSFAVGDLGPWGKAGRWWHGQAAEWDVVAETAEGDALLLGEAKWSEHPFSRRDLQRVAAALLAKRPPDLPSGYEGRPTVRALFVPDVDSDVEEVVHGVHVVSGRRWLRGS